MSGIGGMRPNTVFIKYWKDLDSKNKNHRKYVGFDSISRDEYLQILSDISFTYRKNILLARKYATIFFILIF